MSDERAGDGAPGADDKLADDRGDEVDDGADDLADLIDYVARALVDEPDEVRVELVDGDRAVIIELTVAPNDLGKVIGKDGRTARAMRTLLAASSARTRERAVLEILE